MYVREPWAPHASAVRAMAKCMMKGKFPALHSLQIPIPNRGQGGMQELAHGLCSPHAQSLRSLFIKSSITLNPNLEMVMRQRAQMAALAAALSSEQMGGLHKLTVRGPIFFPNLPALSVGFNSGRLRSLRSLTLINVGIGDHAETDILCEALSAEKMPELRFLSLRQVSKQALQKVLGSWIERPPPPLETLDLARSTVDDEGAAALASLCRMGRVPFLRDVRVGSNKNGLIDSNVWEMLKALFPNTIQIQSGD
mmetsp:Transcript_52014/g.101864  ORF Transcript_52014/g.101864 Transcript_52014/m.101864 type:complete len:253 (-) Transcript_52014:159-917(-)